MAATPAAAPSGSAAIAAVTAAASSVTAKLSKDDLKTLGKQLLAQLNTLFDSDPIIDELGLVVSAAPELYGGEPLPVVDGEDPDDDGPPFILREHKLGVAFWCIPALFGYSQAAFKQARLVLNATADAAITPALVASVMTTSRTLLCVNADHYTAWNARKRLLTLGHASFEYELSFLNLIYSKHPKSGEAWAHRRWVLVQLPATVLSLGRDDWWMSRVAQGEITICERTAELYPKNYYSWTHRQWLVEHITRLPHIIHELGAVTKWTDMHVSDHCGFHHRQVILNALLRLTPRHYSLGACAIDHRYTPPLPCAAGVPSATTALWGSVTIPSATLATAAAAAASSSSSSSSPAASSVPATGPLSASAPCLGCAVWQEELNYTSMQMDRYPGHETLWCHRRFIFSYWLRMIAQHHMDFALNGSIVAGDGAVLKEGWILPMAKKELDFATTAMKDSAVTNYEAERRFASTYHTWVLERVIELLQCAPSYAGRPHPSPPPSSGSTPAVLLSEKHASWMAASLRQAQAVWPNNSTIARDKLVQLYLPVAATTAATAPPLAATPALAK